MLYEIFYESNGKDGKVMVSTDSCENAMKKFRESFEEYGDEAPVGEIVAVWSEQG